MSKAQHMSQDERNEFQAYLDERDQWDLVELQDFYAYEEGPKDKEALAMINAELEARNCWR